MGATLGAALFASAVVLYVLHPILTGRAATMVDPEGLMTESEARKRVALNALRDVEYDYHTGKLDESDYADLRGELTLEAVRALEEGKSPAGAAGTRADSIDAARDPAAGMSTPTGASTPAGPAEVDSLEEEVARLREGLRSGDGCPRCGHLNPPASRYCARCGEALAAALAR